MTWTSRRDFFSYRRKLPHWRARDATYFVTWRVQRSVPDLDPSERSVIFGVLRHFDGVRYALWAFVVMNDHIHVLVTPRSQRLDQIVWSWKAYSARLLRSAGRREGLWQREYFDRIVRSRSDFDEKLRYTLRNPAKRWPSLEFYPWVWCRPECFE